MYDSHLNVRYEKLNYQLRQCVFIRLCQKEGNVLKIKFKILYNVKLLKERKSGKVACRPIEEEPSQVISRHYCIDTILAVNPKKVCDVR